MAAIDLISAFSELANTRSDFPMLTWLDKHGRVEEERKVGELYNSAIRVAAHLATKFEPGERVMLVYPPSLDFAEAFLACLFAGIIPVPAYPPNPIAPGPELETLSEIAKVCGVKALLTNQEYNQARTLGKVRRVFKRGTSHWPKLPLIVTNSKLPAAKSFQPRIPELDEVAFFQCTSGSTSLPKAVLITHRNIAHQVLFNREKLRMGPDAKFLMWVPQYHDLGLISGIISVMYGNGQLFAMSPLSFLHRPAIWLEAISKYRATHTAAPNFAYALAVAKTTRDQRASWDLSCLSIALSAAEPIRESTMERFFQAFRISQFHPECFCPAYGLAEHTVGVSIGGRARISISREELEKGKVHIQEAGPDSLTLLGCGKPRQDIQVRIVNPETCQTLPEGEVGEIWVDSQSKAAGYYGMEALTESIFHAKPANEPGSYLRTGDLGFLFQGEVFVSGRLKDLIIIRGRNIHPQDVENGLAELHPAIRPGNLCAFSVDGDDGETLALAIELRQSKMAENEAREIAVLVREQVLTLALPCDLIVLLPKGAIPKTTSGKLQRQTCRRRLLDGTLNVLARFQWESSGYLNQTEAKKPKKSPLRDLFIKLPSIDEEKRTAKVLEGLCNLLAELLLIDSRDIDPDKNLQEQGLSSMAMVELANRVETSLGRSLDLADFLNYATPRKLSGFLVSLALEAKVTEQQNLRPIFNRALPTQATPLSGDREQMHIGIVGAGVSGISMAYHLHKQGYKRITVLEAGSKGGGKVLSLAGDGVVMEMGQLGVSEMYEDTLALAREFGFELQMMHGQLLRWSEADGLVAVKDHDLTREWCSRVLIAAGECGLGKGDALSGPVGPWLQENGLWPVPYSFWTLWTGYGYGFFEDNLPAAYLVEYVRLLPYGLQSAGNFVKGNQSLWVEIATRLEQDRGVEFQYGKPVTEVHHQHGQIQVKASDDFLFDHLIFACPPHQVAELHPNQEMETCFRRFQTYDYVATVFRAERLPAGSLIFKDAMTLGPPGQLLGTVTLPGRRDTYVGYQYGSKPGAHQELTDDEIEAMLKRDIAKAGGDLSDVLAFRRWDYCPHLSVENYDTLTEIAENQGRDGLWYAGSYLAFETVETSTRFAHDLVRTYFTKSAEKSTDEVPFAKTSFTTIPASPRHERIWLHQQLDPDDPLYNLHFRVMIDGPLDVSRFKACHQAFWERHDGFRASFSKRRNTLYHLVLATDEAPFQFLDFSSFPEDERLHELEKHTREQSAIPFEMDKAPLFRICLYQLSQKYFCLSMTTHHLISDGFCPFIMLKEYSVLYELGLEKGGELLGPALQMSALIAKEHEAKSSAMISLSNLQRVPLHKRKSNAYRRRSQTKKFATGSQIASQLRSLARSEGQSLFDLFLSAYAVLIKRYFHVDRFAVGTPFGNRGTTALQSTFGYLVQPHAFPCDTSVAHFHDLMKQCGDTRLAILQSERQRNAAPQRDEGLFDLWFTCSETVVGNRRIEDMDWHLVCDTPDGSLPGTAKFPLFLAVELLSDDILIHLIYDCDQFESRWIEDFADSYRTLLEQIQESHEYELSQLPILSTEMREKVLYTWNNTSKTDFPDQALHQYFEAQVVRTPHAPAVTFEDEILSYLELNQRANQMAHELRARGVGPDRPVVVILERSLEMVITLYAVLKAGGAYLPLAINDPDRRIKFITSEANCPVMVTRRDLFQGNVACSVLYLEETSFANHPTTNPQTLCVPSNLSYIIYTSGSTGQPKGVMNTHRGIVNRLVWMQDTYKLTAEDRIMQKTPYTFDVSVWEFFWPLMTGAQIVVARPEGHKDPRYLAELIRKRKVSVIHFVPPMLDAFLAEPLSHGETPLRLTICSGQALSPATSNRFHHYLPGVTLENLYGPTEAAIDVTARHCRAGDDKITIGKPIANMRTYILDPLAEPLPPGVHGELYLAGVGLARGYHGRPSLTAEKFLPDPFAHTPGERMYRSGDLAMYESDGDINFLGRIGEQVKLRGFRIELGEIEAVLTSHHRVSEAVVLLRDGDGNAFLEAIIVPDALAPTVLELREHLAEELPDYMIPAQFTTVEKLALTSSGKIDRAAVAKQSGGQKASQGITYQAPQNIDEKVIATVWGDILGYHPVGRNDHFFALGGDSLKAVESVWRLNSTGYSLCPEHLLRFKTPAELAAYIEEAGLRRGSKPLSLDALSIEDTTGLPDHTEVYPATVMQQNMVAKYLTDTDNSGVYHIQIAYILEDNRDLTRDLETAIRALIIRNPALRTLLFDSDHGLLQVIRDTEFPKQIPFKHLNFEQHNDKTLEVDLKEIMDRDLAEGFQFDGQSTLYRFFLLEGHAGRRILLLSFFHGIIDGWSLIEILNELFRSLLRIKAGEEPSYRVGIDAMKEKLALEREVLADEKQQAFWREYLKKISVDESKRTSKPQPYDMRELNPVILEEMAITGLQTLSRVADQSLRTICLNAMFEALTEVNGKQQATLGLVVNGRSERFSDPLHALGLFWNILPVSCNLDPDNNLIERLDMIAEELKRIEPYHHVPLAGTEADPFDIVFNFVHFHNRIDTDARGLRLVKRISRDHFHYPIKCMVIQNTFEHQLHIEFEYDHNRIDLAYVENLLERYLIHLNIAIAAG